MATTTWKKVKFLLKFSFRNGFNYLDYMKMYIPYAKLENINAKVKLFQ
jgi:hypothetical protein